MIQYPTRKVDADRLVWDNQKMVHLLSFPHSKRDPQVELQKLKPELIQQNLIEEPFMMWI